jgi:hypothetical protein
MGSADRSQNPKSVRKRIGIKLKLMDVAPYAMTLDEKIRLGMVALTGASLVFAALGIHIGPLDVIGGHAEG